MATHSSALAWRIPGTAESGGLPSMGSHRVGHDWSDLAVAVALLLQMTLHFKITLYSNFSFFKTGNVFKVSRNCDNVFPCSLLPPPKKLIILILFGKSSRTYGLVSSEVKVSQLCLTLCNPIDYTVLGILQARILEWVAIPFSWGSFWPRNRTGVSCIAGGCYQLSYQGCPKPH